ncbi:magnesium transporter [Tomitella biformata]|uniref:magnesium transporter n=1 Tax=Tomitella biformata TaxID=630403 RepID=UPI0004642C3B|nr:magnesium transporter [Tomitella biformata]
MRTSHIIVTTPERTDSLSERLLRDPAADVLAWIEDTPDPTERSKQVRDLGLEQIQAVAANSSPTVVAALLGAVDFGAAASTLAVLEATTVAGALEHLPVSHGSQLIRRLPEGRGEPVLAAMGQRHRAALTTLLRWPADSAAASMTPSLLTLPHTTTAEDAVKILRRGASQAEAAKYIYLLDDDGAVVGVLSFRNLVVTAPSTPLSEISETAVVSVAPLDDQVEAVRLLQDHDLAAIPIIEHGALLGAVTADRAADIQEDETTEDFRRMSSAGGLTKSLRDASVLALYRSRVVWLVVLVFGNVFSGAGIAHYEDLIQSVVALVFFLPLLIDSGGNAGSQAATLMVRALATGDVLLKDWRKFLVKEISVALLLGLSMAVAVAVLGVIRGGTAVAVVVALTMVIVVIVGSVIGMSLPFLLTKMKLDPASASAPLITSICDGVGVLIYFFIASQILL